MADDEIIVPEEVVRPELPAPVAGALAASPYSFEFTGEDNLRLTVHNSQSGVTVGVHYRLKEPRGRVIANAIRLTPTSDRIATSAEFSIGTGYLLNVSAFAVAGTPRRGQTFVRLQVIRGRGAAAVVLGTIVQGYVTSQQDRAWPGSPVEGSLDGDGYFRSVAGTTPAAGAEISETVPTGARWELVTLYTELACSALAATRVPNLILDTPAILLFAHPALGGTTASDTNGYAWNQGTPLSAAPDPNNFMSGLPRPCILLAGYRFRTATSNRQAGDQFSSPAYTVREWLEAQ